MAQPGMMGMGGAQHPPGAPAPAPAAPPGGVLDLLGGGGQPGGPPPGGAPADPFANLLG